MLSGIVNIKIEPNFKRLGIKKGMLHVYLRNGNIKEIASKISEIGGILSSSIHVGNSDVVADFVYDSSEYLLDTITTIRHMDNVDKVMWSEEVYSFPVSSENVLSTFRRFWENGSNGRNNRDGKKQYQNQTNNRRIKELPHLE